MFCTNCGTPLMSSARFCNECGRPVVPLPGRRPGALLAPSEYEHPSMQQMNQTLRRSVVLTKMAETLSRKIGKPWYESTFNSILVSEKHYPRVYEMSRIAARRLGLDSVPSVYVEMDRGYQSSTFGSERDAFVNLGTYMLRLLNDKELLFVLGHEFGHLASRHALWTTVSMFLVGQQRGNIMAEGILAYLSNPLKILEGGVESVITNWMRVAELTADRAALLAVGDFDAAARTLFLLHLKNRKELDGIDLEAWMAQQARQDPSMVKFSQLATSATPYLGLRLRELKVFHASPKYQDLQRRVDEAFGSGAVELFDGRGYLKKPLGPAAEAVRRSAPAKKPAFRPTTLSGKCPKCLAELTVAVDGADKAKTIENRCPSCGHVFVLNVPRILGRGAGGRDGGPKSGDGSRKVKVARGACPTCGAGFTVPLGNLRGRRAVDLRCGRCGGTFRLPLERPGRGRPAEPDEPDPEE